MQIAISGKSSPTVAALLPDDEAAQAVFASSSVLPRHLSSVD